MKRLIVLAAILMILFATCSCDLFKTDSDRYIPSRSTATGTPFEPDYDLITGSNKKSDNKLDIESGSAGKPIAFPDTSESGGLPRDEYGILIGSMVFDEPVLLMGAYDVINVRLGPDIETERVATIGLGQLAEASEVVDGWYHITVLPGRFEGFTRSDLLVDYDDSIHYYAEDRVDYINNTSTENRLVDVRTVIPGIECYMIFATPFNFTGRTLYSRDIPILQVKTAEKLKKAYGLFELDGYRIKIYDAYRPSSVSGILYSIIGDSTYIAPAGTSVHNRAAAVDMTLIDADGNELEMPSPMHTFNSTSHRSSSVMSAEARKNMNYMTGIMMQCGFTTVSSEWWHFSDSEISNYPPLDFTFSEFSFYEVK